MHQCIFLPAPARITQHTRNNYSIIEIKQQKWTKQAKPMMEYLLPSAFLISSLVSNLGPPTMVTSLGGSSLSLIQTNRPVSSESHKTIVEPSKLESTA